MGAEADVGAAAANGSKVRLSSSMQRAAEVRLESVRSLTKTLRTTQ